MLEPQSTALFILLMVSFGALLWWLLAARQPVFRVLAACLAFIPAAAFGVAAVNKYYGYYETWGAAVAAGCGRRTRPGRRSGSSARAPSFPGSGSAREQATSRTSRMPSSSGRNCNSARRMCRSRSRPGEVTTWPPGGPQSRCCSGG